ncbi:MAG: PD40 domain-containing protein [Candidatus Omnitrophica bacterium]|nr:PD40 domain-containing protein [Candidatus Omnitrophota bacterium]
MNKIKIYILAICLMLGVSKAWAEQSILFSKYTNGYWQIWSKDLNAGLEQQLTSSQMDKHSPQYFAKENKIIFRNANSELFTFDLLNKKEQQILEKFGFIMDQNVSRDGKYMVFARLRNDVLDVSDIWMTDVSKEDAKCLTNESAVEFNPVFSADSKKIVFVSSYKQGKGLSLWIMNIDGTDKQRITNDSSFYVLPSFSPDGKIIIFSSNRTGNYEIGRIDLATKEQKDLTKNNVIDTNASFSSDGKKILFASMQSGTMQVWMMDQDGQNKTQLTSGQGMIRDPAWFK